MLLYFSFDFSVFLFLRGLLGLHHTLKVFLFHNYFLWDTFIIRVLKSDTHDDRFEYQLYLYRWPLYSTHLAPLAKRLEQMRGVEYIKIGPSPFSAFLLKFNMCARKPDWIKKNHINWTREGWQGRLLLKFQTLCCLVWWWCQNVFSKYCSIIVPCHFLNNDHTEKIKFQNLTDNSDIADQ